MQSMTTPTSAQELQSCYVKIGAYMLAEDPVAYANVYQPVYDWYLHNIAGTAATGAARAQRPAPTSRPARQAQSQRAANEPTGRQRNRATPGTPGPKDAQVLAKIVATPAIAIEPLRRYFEAPTRQMTSNILGTAISRLLKAGYITGMPKVGPFTATAMGVEAAKKVTSINTRRRASSKAATGATAAETTEQAAAAG